MNLPNALTALRIFLVPLLVVVLLTRAEHHVFLGAAIFGLAALTDYFDGYLARRRNQVTRLGTVLDPQPAYALGRGMKTLTVRIERHNVSAMAVASWLASDRRAETVYYPGLPQHPDHEVARKQMKGFGGMLCVDVGGGYDRVARFFDRLTLFNRAASLGGASS